MLNTGNISSRIVRKQCEEKSEKKLEKSENKSSRIDLFSQKKNLVFAHNFKISLLHYHPQLVIASGVEWTIQQWRLGVQDLNSQLLPTDIPPDCVHSEADVRHVQHTGSASCARSCAAQ